MKRKQFIHQMSAAAMLAAMGISLESCEKEETLLPSGGGPEPRIVSFDIDTGAFAVLQNDDSWLLHPDEDILLVNVDGTLHALTSVCTHSGCSRNWEYDEMEFTCTCHNSKFSTQGALIQGPARSNLRKFAVEVQGATVTITV